MPKTVSFTTRAGLEVSFTVTGKRLPKECKGEPASQEIAERCEALRDRTTVTVR